MLDSYQLYYTIYVGANLKVKQDILKVANLL